MVRVRSRALLKARASAASFPGPAVLRAALALALEPSAAVQAAHREGSFTAPSANVFHGQNGLEAK
jgi:hypothetical protein